MEIAIFVVAFLLIAGAGLLAFGRMPSRVRRTDGSTEKTSVDTRTAEPPGHLDDSG